MHSIEPVFTLRGAPLPAAAAHAPTVTVLAGAAGFTGLAHARESAKLLLRALWHRTATRDWLAEINGSPLLRALAAARPRLVVKVHRPYLTGTLAPRRRVDVLRAHYDFVQRRGLGALTLAAARGGVVLARFEGKSGTAYRLELRAIEPMEREGELALQLFCADELLYSTAFAFFRDGAAPVLGVGCLQGPKGDGAPDLIRAATRDLHGMRPKQLMVRLLDNTAHALGCTALRLVGNANRAAWRAQRQGRVHADYDAFWRECGAVLRADGDYQLPCGPLAPLDVAAIPSHKRAQARRRHELLQTVGVAVAAALKG